MLNMERKILGYRSYTSRNFQTWLFSASVFTYLYDIASAFSNVLFGFPGPPFPLTFPCMKVNLITVLIPIPKILVFFYVKKRL